MKTQDIHWVAGLLEGEGSFLMRKNRGYRGSIAIALQMTDEDVIQKAASLLRGKVYGPHGPYGQSKKVTWQVVIFGKSAAEWMMTLYPLMGKRRRERIEELLTFWKTQPTQQKERQAVCCENKIMFSKNLCRSCYMKQYHKQRKQDAYSSVGH
jgi:hypothetical protein